MDSQLLKGILEGCVLAVIVKGETYGYAILSELSEYGFENLLEGTLYPVLTRLEKKGTIKCRKEKSPFGPMRKYYSVTDKGMTELEIFKSDFNRIFESAKAVLEDDDEG